jgi:two-component system, NtrC family, nitrogen regulation response regulator GlnG
VKTLLLIDDEESVRYSFRSIFSTAEVEVVTADCAEDGLKKFRERQPDIVVVDLRLPDRSGLEVFAEIQAKAPKKPVVVITAHGTTQTAIEAMKRGAFEYLVKPLDLERLSNVIERAFEAASLMSVPALLPANDTRDEIVGRSAVMQELCKMIGRFAPQAVNVLITGESGTGKELVARALYTHSPRAKHPFLAVNCAAIPEPLLESELFGHEEGAYTGASRQRIGRFEQCAGGTLFLDEIGDMPLSLQAKILRVLQEQRFERVGGSQTVQTQVRVLAATNQDLPTLIAAGKFRKDLFFRLNAITLRVPPLRERLEDISELAHYFLFRFDREFNMQLRGFAPETLERFQRHAWPGNVRELQGVVKHAMLNASGPLILPEFLDESVFEQEKHGPVTTSPAGDVAELVDSLLRSGAGELHAKAIAAVERILFAKVLEHTRGNQGKACDLLGMNRSTLRHRLRLLGLTIDKIAVDRTSDISDKPVAEG